MAKILILSEYPERLLPFLEKEAVKTSNAEPYPWEWPDWIVMYGYRHIIKGELLHRYRGRIINIHASYLPYNRGASPNLWSWYDGTPSGVSIHFVDNGPVDSGDIIVRQPVAWSDEMHSLYTTYNDLQDCAGVLFQEWWPRIKAGRIDPIAQIEGEGTYHNKRQTEALMMEFPNGWDTLIQDVIEAGRRNRDGKTI